MPTQSSTLIKTALTNLHKIPQSYIRSLKYIFKELRRAKRFRNRDQLLDFSLHCSGLNGLILEFGVAGGASINYLASLVPNETVYGFDCFTGLPENWGTLPVGHFKIDVLPTVRENVKLVGGLFQENKEKIRFLHLDSDLYSSTIYVLKALMEQKPIQEGTVIQFDELFNYINWWKDGEYKALKELIRMHEIEYEILGYSLNSGYGGAPVAIIIRRILS
jgi:hypothetical protein